MADNKDLNEGKKLLKDSTIEVGFLDNAFKTLGATISSVLENAIDSMGGLDDITQKVAKSYQRDIASSINKSTKGLEDQIDLTLKINKGQNVSKELNEKLTRNQARRQLTLAKINNLEGVSNKEKNRLLGTANDVFKAEEAALKALIEQNEEKQKAKPLFQLLKENAGSLADKIDKSGTLSKVLNKGIGSVLTTARLLEIAVLGILDAMISVDKQNGELAKSLNISVTEAAQLTTELTEAANKSGYISITTAGLAEALMASNKELGVFNTTIDDNLIQFQKLHKSAGLTFEELKGIKAVTDASGTDLKSNTKEFFAQARLTSQRFKVALNEKELFKDISNVSAATTLSLGKQPGAIAKALTVTKALGMEMSKVEGIADSLLDFESSIEKELQAELLLGKDINLEKARQAALNNDIAGVAEEIAKQAGSAADFAKLNRIQQQALADAVGMSREELAESLFVQEQIGNLTGDEYELRKKQIEDLQKEGLSQKEIEKRLGEESLEDLQHQNSIQENFNKILKKSKELFVSIAGPVMKIVTPFVEMLIPAFEMLSYILIPIKATFEGIASSIGYIADSVSGFYNLLTGANTELSLMQSIVGAIAISYGLITAYNKSIALYSTIRSKMEGKTVGSLIKQGFVMVKNLGIAIAEAVAKISGASAATLGIAGGIALAAGAAAYAFLSTKGDDILSPGGSSSGYGNRTLLGPEGAIALNNKDTVIAGTNLFPKDARTNQTSQVVQQDNSEMKKTNMLLQQILTKQGTVTMDSTEVGTAFAMGAYQVQ